MAIIDVPASVGFAEADWELATPFQDNRSGWTGARRGALGPGVAHWTVTASFADIDLGHPAAAPHRAFLAKLNGSANSFRFPAAINQHLMTIAPTVKAGAVAGQTLLTMQGLPASRLILPAGYYITVQRAGGKAQMLLLTEPLNSNGLGEAIALFEPQLISVPVTGSLVETRNPWCLVSLVDSKVGWTHGKNTSHRFKPIAAEEVV